MPVSGLGWAGRLLAGHDPDLDTTAVELPLLGRELSLLVLLPGQIRQFVTGGWQRCRAVTVVTLSLFQEGWPSWRPS